MRKGIGVSPGVAVGTAYCINEIFVSPDTKPLDEDEVLAELARFDRLAQNGGRSPRPVPKGRHPGRARRSRDLSGPRVDPARPDFHRQIRAGIVDDRATAAAALDRLLSEYTALFAAHQGRIHQGAAGRRPRRGYPAQQPS